MAMGRDCHGKIVVTLPVDIGPVAEGPVGRGRQEQLDLLVGEWGGEPLLAACEEEGMGTALDGDLGGSI